MVDFQISDEIISHAEQTQEKQRSKKGASCSQSKLLTLSDILESYSKVMAKMGIDSHKENKYYSMMVKLSIA